MTPLIASVTPVSIREKRARISSSLAKRPLRK